MLRTVGVTFSRFCPVSFLCNGVIFSEIILHFRTVVVLMPYVPNAKHFLGKDGL